MSLLEEMATNLPPDKTFELVRLIHGHFYYVQNKEDPAAPPMPLTLPSRLQKEKVDCYVGDIVEVDTQNKVIKSVLPRKALLSRPKVANVDQAIVVTSVTQPLAEPEYLDRVLCHAGLTLSDTPIICLTKLDLAHSPDMFKLYKKLGYKIIETSNIDLRGIAELQSLLAGKMSVLAGHSGVGKSTLMASLFPKLAFKTGEVSHKSTKGTHTTRHVEIFEGDVNGTKFWLLDTPGFSRLDAQFSQNEIASAKAFPEIGEEREACKFPDCKHLYEEGCTVSFVESRRSSYIKLMDEADKREDYQLESRQVKSLNERVKSKSDVSIPLLRNVLRATSRKKGKQQFDFEQQMEEEE